MSKLTALPTSVPVPSPTPSQSSKPLWAVEPTAEPLESKNVYVSVPSDNISALFPVAANVTVLSPLLSVPVIVVASPLVSVNVAEIVVSVAVVPAGILIEIVPLFKNLPEAVENSSFVATIAGLIVDTAPAVTPEPTGSKTTSSTSPSVAANSILILLVVES